AELKAGAGGDGYLGAWSKPEPRSDADLVRPPDGFATRTRLQPQGAVDFIVQTIKANPHEITILAIGPLTNIALAVVTECVVGAGIHADAIAHAQPLHRHERLGHALAQPLVARDHGDAHDLHKALRLQLHRHGTQLPVVAHGVVVAVDDDLGRGRACAPAHARAARERGGG
ncbi:MAG: nucleoside hydrolase, partial [Proteobacteria bacterium]|nr:nucleoside hydrolase [Pseudomonadota bacterium]